ncbi:hypothetical protein [Haladaptatus sp. NG-WS-4]
MDESLVEAGIVLMAAAVGLFFGGAIGVFVVGFVLVIVGLVLSDDRHDTDGRHDGGKRVEGDGEHETSCPDCGARNDHGRTTCYYCGSGLSEV